MKAKSHKLFSRLKKKNIICTSLNIKQNYDDITIMCIIRSIERNFMLHNISTKLLNQTILRPSTIRISFIYKRKELLINCTYTLI